MTTRVSLLCGSLEPGTNGVGDYSRLLAAAFASEGMEVQLISLSDRHADQDLKAGGVVLEEETNTRIVRLAQTLPQDQRIKRLKEELADFQPAFVSLQYVLTSFHPKGMPWAFNRALTEALRPYKTHVMLHEAWFGLDPGARVTQKIYGVIQKQLLFSFLRALKPDLLTLSNPYYKELLNQGGFNSHYLPIYATVALSQNSNGQWLPEKLRELGLDTPERFLSFGFFGGIFPNTPGPALLTRAGELAALEGKKALILSAGRGGAGKYLFQQWAQTYPDMTFMELGSLPDEQVYSYLMGLDYGLTGYPHYLLGKSSQVAAMLEVGLPFLVGQQGQLMPEDPLPPEGMELTLRADRPLEDWPKNWQTALPRGRRSVASPEDVAREMLAQLS
ncbi:hypothetical protein ACTL6U_13025 [Rhodovibrionaceae bacterium A322]